MYVIFKDFYVGLRTAQGTALVNTSCVTAHLYLSSFTTMGLLTFGSLIGVNLTSIKSLALRGFFEIGQYMVLSLEQNVLYSKRIW